MELFLHRTYLPNATVGKLSHQNKAICETIEQRWRDNRRYISCIPEGRYRLVKKQHEQHGVQLAMEVVPNREAITVRSIPSSLGQVQGGIVPATKVKRNGEWLYSRVARERLLELVLPLLQAGEKVYLTIKSVS